MWTLRNIVKSPEKEMKIIVWSKIFIDDWNVFLFFQQNVWSDNECQTTLAKSEHHIKVNIYFFLAYVYED